jgi:hypothetical protein
MARTQTHATSPTGRSIALPPPAPPRTRTTLKPRTAQPVREVEEDIEEEQPELSRRVMRRIEDVRAPFKTHVTMFGHMDEKAADLAPDFMKAFRAWKDETKGSFVTFVRMFDDTVPVNRDPDPKDRANTGYKAHRTYRAADYLRRLVPGEEGEEAAEKEGGGPVSVSDAFVRLLAAIVALIPGNQVEKLWEVIGTELHWSQGKVATLRTSVEEVEPLVEARVERNTLVVEEA